LQPFAAYSQKAAAIWDDIFNFMLHANPRYEELGKSSASMLDFGQWDHPDYYDGRYESCDAWGQKRWSTPAAIINGQLACTRLSLLNAGMEEFLDYSYQTRAPLNSDNIIKHDPNGNPISAYHPWNKKTQVSQTLNPQAYSWGSSLIWQGHGFEVGAYARLYLTAVAQKIPKSEYLNATGSGMDFLLPTASGSEIKMNWQAPLVWNAFERNRARAYALIFNLTVTQENIASAHRLVRSGNTQTHVAFPKISEPKINDRETNDKNGQKLGVGLWGASRGFLAHWTVIKDQVIDNYQIAIPSRVNVGTCTPMQEPGPLEKALINTPIIESNFKNSADFSAIDIQRTIQSFDPCMNCSSHVLINGSNKLLEKIVDTSFPI
jgi:hydrogenase large subunit